MRTNRKPGFKCLLSSILLVAGIPAAGVAAEPVLQPGVDIQDGAGPMTVLVMSAPTVVDWNNNGKKDLVLGHFSQGWIRVFLNQGTDENPVFDGGFLVQSDGVDISTSFG